MREGKEHPLINRVKEQFAEGLMDRREFLRYSTLLGLSVATAYAFVGKVIGVDYVPQARAASMKKGGILRIGHLTHAAMRQPHTMSWFAFSDVTFPVIQTLTRTGADNLTRPLLAESWTASDDLRTWTIKLAKGAAWTDGSPVTADDIIANFKHLLDPATGSSTMGLMAYLLKEVEKDGEKTKELWDANALEVVDDRTINFNLRVPQVAIPEHLFHYTNGMCDPASGFEMGPGINGSGPFDCVELSPKDKVVLKAKRGYWGKEAYVDSVEFIDIGADPTAQFAALASKQVHGLHELQSDQVDAVKQQEHLKIYTTPTGRASTLSFRVDHEPWGDNRVRQAVRLAAVEKNLTKAALGEWGTPGEHHHVSSIHPEYVDLGPPEHNIEKAKALLAEAGFADGIETDITVLNEPESLLKLATAWKDQLGKIGIKLNIKPVTSDAFWGLWDKDVVTCTYWSHRPLAIQIMALVYRTGVPWNTFRWGSDELDVALEKAEGTVEVEDRKKYVKRIEEILQNEGPMAQPMFWNALTAWNKNIEGFSCHPSLCIFVEDLSIES
jgi:peptide/nickel transport system substrate-binding protein